MSAALNRLLACVGLAVDAAPPDDDLEALLEPLPTVPAPSRLAALAALCRTARAPATPTRADADAHAC